MDQPVDEVSVPKYAFRPAESLNRIFTDSQLDGAVTHTDTAVEGECMSMSFAEAEPKMVVSRVFEDPSNGWCHIQDHIRSGAGDKINPANLRPPLVLDKTMHYLVHHVLRAPRNVKFNAIPLDRFRYLLDRFRRIRTQWVPQFPAGAIADAMAARRAANTKDDAIMEDSALNDSGTVKVAPGQDPKQALFAYNCTRRKRWLEFQARCILAFNVDCTRNHAMCVEHLPEKQQILEALKDAFGALIHYYRTEQRTRSAEMVSILVIFYGLNQLKKVESSDHWCRFDEATNDLENPLRAANVRDAYAELEYFPHVTVTPQVQEALELVHAVQQRQWFRFFSLIKNSTTLTFFQKCCLTHSFTYVRFRAVADLVTISGKQQARVRGNVSVEWLSDALLFDSIEDCVGFLNGMGLGDHVADNGAGLMLTVSQNNAPVATAQSLATAAQGTKRGAPRAGVYFPASSAFLGLQDAIVEELLGESTDPLNGSTETFVRDLRSEHCPLNWMRFLEPHCPSYNWRLQEVDLERNGIDKLPESFFSELVMTRRNAVEGSTSAAVNDDTVAIESESDQCSTQGTGDGKLGITPFALRPSAFTADAGSPTTKPSGVLSTAMQNASAQQNADDSLDTSAVDPLAAYNTAIDTILAEHRALVGDLGCQDLYAEFKIQVLQEARDAVAQQEAAGRAPIETAEQGEFAQITKVFTSTKPAAPPVTLKPVTPATLSQPKSSTFGMKAAVAESPASSVMDDEDDEEWDEEDEEEDFEGDEEEGESVEVSDEEEASDADGDDDALQTKRSRQEAAGALAIVPPDAKHSPSKYPIIEPETPPTPIAIPPKFTVGPKPVSLPEAASSQSGFPAQPAASTGSDKAAAVPPKAFVADPAPGKKSPQFAAPLAVTKQPPAPSSTAAPKVSLSSSMPAPAKRPMSRTSILREAIRATNSSRKNRRGHPRPETVGPSIKRRYLQAQSNAEGRPCSRQALLPVDWVRPLHDLHTLIFRRQQELATLGLPDVISASRRAASRRSSTGNVSASRVSQSGLWNASGILGSASASSPVDSCAQANSNQQFFHVVHTSATRYLGARPNTAGVEEDVFERTTLPLLSSTVLVVGDFPTSCVTPSASHAVASMMRSDNGGHVDMLPESGDCLGRSVRQCQSSDGPVQQPSFASEVTAFAVDHDHVKGVYFQPGSSAAANDPEQQSLLQEESVARVAAAVVVIDGTEEGMIRAENSIAQLLDPEATIWVGSLVLVSAVPNDASAAFGEETTYNAALISAARSLLRRRDEANRSGKRRNAPSEAGAASESSSSGLSLIDGHSAFRNGKQLRGLLDDSLLEALKSAGCAFASATSPQGFADGRRGRF